MNSLHKILKLNPATIYPGHGPVVKNGEERVRQYIEHRNKRNEQIMDALKSSKEPLNPEELVKIIYVGLNENLIHAAMFNVSNHLSALLKQNRVGMQITDRILVPWAKLSIFICFICCFREIK